MIGIVGGVGPFAGIDLLEKVYRNTLANTDQEHLDTMLLSQSSIIGDRTEYLMGKLDKNPGYALADVIEKLSDSGAKVAGIPCNTAHSQKIFNLIEAELKNRKLPVKLLNMIGETIGFISQRFPQVNHVGILATTGTMMSRVYEDPLEKLGFNVIKPPRKMQEELIHPAIYHPEYGIKSTSGRIHDKAVQNLMKGMTYLRNQGAEVVILGCTEIPLAIKDKKVLEMNMIDPTNILARALIREDRPEKLKPY